MNEENRWLALAIIIMSALLIFLYSVKLAPARDIGQWQNTEPETSEWFSSLKQPDNPAVSCCGESDAYWADSFKVIKDEVSGETRYVAIITDTRPDEPLKRVHVDVGTEIEVPNNKLVDAIKQQNPTGHGIIFLSRGYQVYCYLAPGGV